MSASLLFTAFSGAVVSSLVPFVHAEVLLLGLALAAPDAAPLLAVVVAVGQMAGKSALFLGSRRMSQDALAARLERWHFGGRWRVAGGPLVGLSALTGLPPFYLLSIAAPALGVRFRTFLMMGLAGRVLRFGALALLPQLFSRVARMGGL